MNYVINNITNNKLSNMLNSNHTGRIASCNFINTSNLTNSNMNDKTPNSMNRNIKSLSLITKQAMTVHNNRHNAADSIDDKRVCFANFLNTTSKKELFVDDNTESKVYGQSIQYGQSSQSGQSNNNLKNKHFINYNYNLNTPLTSTIKNSENNINENMPEVKKYISENIIPFSSSYNLINNNSSSSNYASSSLEEALESGSPQIINIYNINNNYNIGNITLDNDKTKPVNNTLKQSFGSNTATNNNKFIQKNGNKSTTNNDNKIKQLKSCSFINIAGSIPVKETKSSTNSATHRKNENYFTTQPLNTNFISATLKKVIYFRNSLLTY